MDNVTWKWLLGADVNNLDHLRLSLGLTKEFLRHCQSPHSGWQKEVPPEAQFTPHEQRLLQLVAVTHDWGEARSGDTPYHLKNNEAALLESAHLRDIFSEVFGSNEIDSLDIEKTANEVIAIESDKESKLGKAFNAIERAGYVRTGLRAYALSSTADDGLKDNLRLIGLHVVPYHINTLLDYAKIYPPVHSYLERQTATISDVIQEAADTQVVSISSFDVLALRNKWHEEFVNTL